MIDCESRFSNALIYYGVSLFIPRLGGNDFLNFFIVGAVEIPGYLIAQVSIRYFGRRIPLCITMLVGGASLLVTMAIPDGEYFCAPSAVWQSSFDQWIVGRAAGTTCAVRLWHAKR